MSLQETADKLKKEIAELKESIKLRDKLLMHLKNELTHSHNLTSDEICRYSRHMFIENIGVAGQEKLKSSSVLIVGCGGLGCPASQYLAGIGVGKIGLVDYDNVELSNLHRQVLHTEDFVGVSKVKSLSNAIKRLNSNVVVEEYSLQLNSSNAKQILLNYDVIIDASDNVPTRYLLNDACVLTQRPLVSGAAVRMEGQLTVYNYNGGPCYRCIFPKPPPPTTVSNCGDVGVLPPVPGLVGVLEALQAIHILLGNENGILKEKMLLFDGFDVGFNCIKLRPKSPNCSICSETPSITSLIDYEQFCGSPANDKERGVKLYPDEERVSVFELKTALSEPTTVLLDVRSKVEYDMCRIAGSISIPLDQLTEQNEVISQLVYGQPSSSKVYVICRRGNDSQLAVSKLRETHPKSNFVDVIGGLHSWAKLVDQSFPVY